jgi:hypothetical protein
MGRLFSSSGDYEKAVRTAPPEPGYSTLGLWLLRCSGAWRQLFHRHVFEPVAAQSHLFAPNLPYDPERPVTAQAVAEVQNKILSEGYGVIKTQILRKCVCGAVRVEIIAGQWTLDQINGMRGYQ